jgi:hypothetical protein
LNFCTDENKVFGGFFVIAMGDFRQILSVRSINRMKASISDPAELAKKSQLVADGGSLWRMFRLVTFKRQQRATEALQQRRLEIFRSGMITEELLSGFARLTLEELRGDLGRRSLFTRTRNGSPSTASSRSASRR